MTYLRPAIVGYGRVAALHAAALARIEGVRLAGVYGPAPAKAARFAARHGGVPFESLTDLARSADAAILASPTPAHVPQALAITAQGTPVLVELPAAENASSAVVLASAGDGLVRAAHTSRWLPANTWARTLLQAGALGAIRSITFDRAVRRPERSWQDDPLLHHGQHAIDLLGWWFGAHVVVTAAARPDGLEVTWTATVGPSGQAAVRIEHGAPEDRLTIRVVGTRGVLASDGFGSAVATIDGAASSFEMALDLAYEQAIHDQDAAFLESLTDPGAYPPFDETLMNLRLIDRIRLLANGPEPAP